MAVLAPFRRDRSPAAAPRPQRRLLAAVLGSPLAVLVFAPAPAAALTFNTTFESSVTTSPYADQFKTAFQAAANTFASAFVNPVTVNLQVGLGTLAGSTVTSLGVSGSAGYGSYSYSQMSSMLRATATSSYDRTAYASLPAINPAGSRSYTLTPALAKALGVAPATGGGIDGYIGFGGSYSFDFNRTDGIAAGSYDFMGVAMHEISHVLGRVSGLIASPVNALPIDAFRYTAPGTASFDYNASTYFSIDGGVTDLANFATGSAERDSWVFTSGDAYSYAATSGVVNDLSVADKIVMDVLGWNTEAGTTTPVYGTMTTTTTTTTTSGGGGGKGRKSRQDATYDVADIAAVPVETPEPGSLAILATGLLGIGVAARRRTRTA